MTRDRILYYADNILFWGVLATLTVTAVVYEPVIFFVVFGILFIREFIKP